VGIRKANQVSQHNLKNMHDNKHYRLMYFAYASLVEVHTCIIVYDKKIKFWNFEAQLVDDHVIISF